MHQVQSEGGVKQDRELGPALATGDGRARRVVRNASVVAALAGTVSFMAVQYRMPATWVSAVGLADRGAVIHFSHALWGAIPREMSERDYQVALVAMLTLAWTGYAVAIQMARRCAPLRRWQSLALATAAGLTLAFLAPPSLTPDVYLYASYARMELLFGISPYIHRFDELAAVGLPHARFLGSSGYGPLWTLLALGICAPLSAAGLWWQVVALKLLEAAALIGGALAARGIAEHYESGKGDLTLMAVCLNPLLLIEGPGVGHNDLLLISAMLAGLHVSLRGRYLAGVLTVGLSVAMKFITAAVVPWMYIDRIRASRGRYWLPLLLATGVMALGPVLLCYAPFWRGAPTLAGVLQNSGRGTKSPLPILLVYLALLPWLWRHANQGKWTTAWVAVTLLLFFSTNDWHPWYLTWPFVVSLTRWDQPNAGTSAVCLCVAFAMMFLYSVSG